MYHMHAKINNSSNLGNEAPNIKRDMAIMVLLSTVSKTDLSADILKDIMYVYDICIVFPSKLLK